MQKRRLVACVIMLAITAIMPIIYSQNQRNLSPELDTVLFGVSFGGSMVDQAKLLIDKVKNYTNLFVINSWEICGASNESLLEEICEYAVNANLKIMVYFNFVYYNYTEYYGNIYNASSWDLYGVAPWHIQWLNHAMEKWGDRFLGVYLYDEPGGKQIDLGYWDGVPMTGEPPDIFVNVSKYNQAAERFIASLRNSGSMQHITNTSASGAVNRRVRVFTSDYALFWFDYLGGYDGVFAELGSARGEAEDFQQVALCRGAATVQNKEWGVMVTWAFKEPPYLEGAAELFEDLVLAYNAGADYMIVFDFPFNASNPYGILTEDHFRVMEQFWLYIHASPPATSGRVERVALVLPKDYGWGMRWADDKIWGLWPADDFAFQLWRVVEEMIVKYGDRLDIVYDDSRFNFSGKYVKLHYWNGTVVG